MYEKLTYYRSHMDNDAYKLFYVHYLKQKQDALKFLTGLEKIYSKFVLKDYLKLVFTNEYDNLRDIKRQVDVFENTDVIRRGSFTEDYLDRITGRPKHYIRVINIMKDYDMDEDVSRLVQISILKLSNLSVLKRDQLKMIKDRENLRVNNYSATLNNKLNTTYRDILKTQNGGVGDYTAIVLNTSPQKYFDDDGNVSRVEPSKRLTLNYNGDDRTFEIQQDWLSGVARNGIAVVDQKVTLNAKLFSVDDDCKIYKATWARKIHEKNNSRFRTRINRDWIKEEGYIGIIGDPNNPIAVRSSMSVGHIMDMTKRSGVKNVLGNIFDD